MVPKKAVFSQKKGQIRLPGFTLLIWYYKNGFNKAISFFQNSICKSMTFGIDYAHKDFSGLARFCFSTFRVENRYFILIQQDIYCQRVINASKICK
jgi:hypothetical protein